MREEIAILDIGSGKLVFAVGQKSAEDNFCIRNFASTQYQGYYQGEWVDKDMLPQFIANIVKQSNFDRKTKTLYVAVPSEFTKIRTNGLLTNYSKKKVISENVIRDIHNRADNMKLDGYSVLCSSALEYILNDYQHTLLPIGESADRVYANMSYIYCKDDFIHTICDIGAKLGFKYVKFIDNIWAQATQLINQQTREKGALLIDIGYASTTIAYIKGDGIKYKADIAYGYGFLVDSLAQALDVSYDVANSMINQITLNIESDESSTYHYTNDGRVYECKAREINNFLHSMITNNLVDFVNATIYEIKDKEFVSNSQDSDYKDGFITGDTQFYLSGGGLASIRGAIKFFERALAKNLTILTPKEAGWDKPYFSSVFATMEVADKLNRKNSLLEKIFG